MTDDAPPQPMTEYEAIEAFLAENGQPLRQRKVKVYKSVEKAFEAAMNQIVEDELDDGPQ